MKYNTIEKYVPRLELALALKELQKYDPDWERDGDMLYTPYSLGAIALKEERLRKYVTNLPDFANWELVRLVSNEKYGGNDWSACLTWKENEKIQMVISSTISEVSHSDIFPLF